MKSLARRSSVSTIAVFLLATVLFVAVAACGSDTESSTDTSDQTTEVAPKAETKTEAPAAETKSSGMPDEFESETFKGLGDTEGFAGTTFAHGTFDTRDYEGKPIVVNFWFPSCPPCRAELEHFEEVYQEFGEPSGSDIQFVGVQQLGLDSIEDGAALFDELGVTFPGLPDNASSIQIAYSVFSYPTTVFLDRNHNEHRVWQGAIDKENLAEIVQELAAGGSLQIEEESQPAEGDAVAVDLESGADERRRTRIWRFPKRFTPTQKRSQDLVTPPVSKETRSTTALLISAGTKANQ